MALAAIDEAPRALTEGGARASRLMDDLRVMMEGEMQAIEERCQTYLRWYSPPYNSAIRTHDAWLEPLAYDDIDTTRDNFPLARAVVDIWSSLEAAKPPTVRAEPERVPPPLPMLAGPAAFQASLQYQAERQMESTNSDLRSARIRKWMRDDQFALKHHAAVRRKNLFGFSWTKTLPQPWRKRPSTVVLRNPTTVYPLWSDRTPGDLEAVFSAQQVAARRANALWPQLNLQFGDPRNPAMVTFERGEDSGEYRDQNDHWYDQSRTMVWVEELWYVEREFGDLGRVKSSAVWCAIRVCNQIVYLERWDGWTKVPFTYWENTDERDSFGWSDIANVIDINDEFNRRVSQQGDVIRMFSSPRFQLLGSLEGRDVEMPGPFQLIPLQDQERIEQILARIDVYPTVQHFDVLTDLLHRVSGLPPIVWGLIANAQTSGRALSASWKATEARLSPKLMRNEQSCRNHLDIVLDQARFYDWYGAKAAFTARDRTEFDDWTWTFPPMEPRDFTEVSMNAITLRDAGLITTTTAMRQAGVEDAESELEGVIAEFDDINHHPDKKNAKLLAQRAELDNIMFAQQMQAQMQGPAAGPAAGPPAGGAPAGPPAGPQAAAPPGMEGALPPTTAGSSGNAGAPIAPPGGSLTGGTLVRNGEASTQLLSTTQFGG